MKEQRNYVLQTLDELCGFHDRGTTFQADFLSTSTTLELERFKCVLFYRAKFAFLLKFHGHSVLDRLNYFLLRCC